MIYETRFKWQVMKKRIFAAVAMTGLFCANVLMLPHAQMHMAALSSVSPQWMMSAVSIITDAMTLPMLVVLYFCSLGELILFCSLVDVVHRISGKRM